MEHALIEKANIEDFDDIEVIEKQAFSDPFSKELYISDILNNPYAVYYKLLCDNKLIGYFGLWVIYENVQITTIAVSPLYQRLGFGQVMMDFIVSMVKKQEAENITLEVRKSNHKAIKYYEKNNFMIVAIRKNYYDDGEDAYLMKLDL